MSNGSPINTNNFNIVHYNINSITAEGRIEQLSNICNILNLDVLILTESKIDQTIPNYLIRIAGYHEPIRRDRPVNGRNGGGVLIYIAEHLTFQQKNELQSENFEHIWVDIKIRNVKFAINALYRPPNESAECHRLFLDTADNILKDLSNYNANQKIVTSDLNFGNIYCKFPILSPKSLDATAPDLFSSYGFSQLLDIPTRITNDTTSLIDLFFEHNIDNVVCHGTIPKIADHEGILVSYNITCEQPKARTKQIFDYKNADIPGLIDYIKQFDFDSTVFCHPTVTQAELYSKVLTDAFSLFVPCKTVLIRQVDQCWSNTFTRLLLRKKNRNYQLYKKACVNYEHVISQPNTPPDIITKYLARKNKAYLKSRNAANESTKANRRAKTALYSSVNSTMNNFNISAKKKFSILLKLMKNNKFSPTPPIIENNDTINDPTLKGEIFNAFFAAKSTVQGSDDLPPNLQRLDGISSQQSLNTSPLEVGKIIRGLKKSHSSYCGISGKFLQLISTQISGSLSKLFNNLFDIGHFPDIWKIAHIIPIYKRSGSKNSKSSFRPISILPTLSKVIEAVIHDRLLNHCMENDVISERQAAYLKGDSTISQLIYIVHQIRQQWGHSKIIQGAFLDISAAFDKVWHRGLISKLSQIGIDGTYLDLFKSYLFDRKQCVVVDGVKSSLLKVNAGVPQGSRLGPLLFIIYINDIITDIESEILIFADDTTLLATGTDPAETSAQLNRDLAKISAWADVWKITFNAGKSKDVIFSKKVLNNSPPLLFNNMFIERVNTHKHLGVYLNSELDWSKQIHEVCLKANRKLSVLRSVKLLHRKTLDLLFKVTVRSVIDYALPIYANTLKQTELARLEQLQYRAAKLVSGALHFTSREKLNNELGWESIKRRIEFLGLSLFHKIHLQETRPLIKKCMPKLDFEKKHVTRSKGGYTPFPNLGHKFLNSFFPFYSKLWNNLKHETQVKNLQDFKLQIKEDLKPEKIRHYAKGPKASNIFITRLRVGRSDLNLHKFSVGLIDKPDCDCHAKEESTIHYLLDCFLYTVERQTLCDLVEHHVPNFSRLTRIAKIDLLLFGIKLNDPDYNRLNVVLTKAIQTYIVQTKRFLHK